MSRELKAALKMTVFGAIVILAGVITALPVEGNEHAMNQCFEKDGIPLMESRDSNVMEKCLIK